MVLKALVDKRMGKLEEAAAPQPAESSASGAVAKPAEPSPTEFDSDEAPLLAPKGEGPTLAQLPSAEPAPQQP
eukprot:8104248-Pyramimonas_sp.AAC.1